jgi:hypothetical protein
MLPYDLGSQDAMRYDSLDLADCRVAYSPICTLLGLGAIV